MKTTIYLTRHGQTQWNLEKRLQGRENSPLTKEGVSRAEELAKRIEGLEIDAIYTSPIERAKKTAEIIRGKQQMPLIEVDGLMEMSFGAYEGELIETLKSTDSNWNIEEIMKGNTEMCAPGGEDLTSLRARVGTAMQTIIQENRGKKVLIVAHGMTLKALMYYFKDNETSGMVMGQVTLTKIEVDEKDNVEVIYKNDGSHFNCPTEQAGW